MGIGVMKRIILSFLCTSIINKTGDSFWGNSLSGVSEDCV